MYVRQITEAFGDAQQGVCVEGKRSLLVYQYVTLHTVGASVLQHYHNLIASGYQITLHMQCVRTNELKVIIHPQVGASLAIFGLHQLHQGAADT